MSSKSTKIAVGLFVVIFIVATVAIIAYVFLTKGAFEKRYSYHFKSYTASAVTTGVPVKVSGFTIGRLDTIELQDDGSVEFIFSVDEKNRKWVCKESIVMIRKPLIGSSYIILYSALGNPILEEGSELESIMSNDINDLIIKLEPIVNKMENIVASIDTITSYLASEDSELKKTIINLERFSANLAQNRALLTSVTGDQNATNALIESMESLPKLIRNYSQIGGNVNEKIIPSVASLVDDIAKIIQDVQSKLKQLDGIVQSVSSYDKDIDQIKEQIYTGLQKSNEIIEKVDALFLDEKKSKVELP